tara:strand:- start:12170 stop:12319 length:150 start_codon:yes stop_codon:yes gene_type:complete
MTEKVSIDLPKEIALSLLTFINTNMQVKGKDGAEALLTIVSAFEEALVE